MGKYCFGIDIGGTTVKCGLFTNDGSCISKWEIPTRKEDAGKRILHDVADTIAEKMKSESLTKEEVIGIGIGVPGPVTEDGRVLKCANLGWEIFNVSDKMQELTGFSTAVGNDANVAALGEMWMGGGKGHSNVVMITLGTGVGGGIIINGKVVSGSNGAGGEIGHMIVNPEETELCGCGGHGHLEQYASATGIVRMAKKKLTLDHRDSKLRELKELTAKDIFEAAKANDPLAKELVETLGSYLGRALANVACVADPEVFVIGGGVSKAGEILIEVIEKNYNSNLIFALKGKEFKLATLGNDAGIYGCAKLVLNR